MWNFGLLSSLILLTARVKGDDDVGYQNDAAAAYDYNYENQDYVEEPQPSLIPQFTTEAKHFKVAKDRILRLPCHVDQLGPMVISWKKSDGQGGPLQYLATGTHRLTSDTRVSVEESNEQGSTLVISFANDQDVGDYVCEVSSNPPATLRHHVSLIVHPSVSILKPPEDTYRIYNGEELALVCKGEGDPAPTLSWKRERKRMPDGHNKIYGAQVIYSNVTRKHSGTYVCEGSNGSGFIAKDTIKIDVIHPPEITGEQSYIQDEGSIMLELVCIVHAYPKAEVTWYKDGQQLVESDTITVEKIGRKHLLQVRNLDEIRDAGTYTCHAVNPVGEFKENFHIQVSSDPSLSSAHQTSSQTVFQSDGTMADDTQVEPIIGAGSSTLISSLISISTLLVIPWLM